MKNNFIKEDSSFKDSDATVGFLDNKLIRIINKNYKQTFKKFIECGLYEKLLSKNLIIEHKVLDENEKEIIIQPKEIFISYPWEWSFSMLKDAALATLKIQKIALKYGFSLKDGNYFNIQFENNKPLLIDTTSFEEFNSTWVGYNQFCTNFLAPLLLMAHKDLKLQNLIISNISGIDLNLTSKLLPIKTWFNFNILSHIHFHAIFSKKYSSSKKKISVQKIKKEQMIYFIDSLISMVKNINLPKQQTEWGEYYSFTNYNDISFKDKKEKVLNFASLINAKKIIDFGANTGEFSKLFKNSFVYSTDFDKLAVEYNYLDCKKNGINNIFPLVFDILNPSASLGFLNKERKDLYTRLKDIDLILALALVHHLKITNNVPFELQAKFFSKFGKNLIVEFIPKDDSKVEQMLLNRENDFDDYNIEAFEREYSKYFNILKKESISSSKRFLYLMERK